MEQTKRYDLIAVYKAFSGSEPRDKFLTVLLSFEEMVNDAYLDGYEDGQRAVIA